MGIQAIVEQVLRTCLYTPVHCGSRGADPWVDAAQAIHAGRSEFPESVDRGLILWLCQQPTLD